MEIQAKQTFVHGPVFLAKGKRATVADAIANDLVSAGLAEIVEQKAMPTPENKMIDAYENKEKVSAQRKRRSE